MNFMSNILVLDTMKRKVLEAGYFILSAALLAGYNPAHADSGYIKGDFHQHTTYTDGSNSIATMMYMNKKYGLDWWANSEHGGGFNTDASGNLLTAPPFDPVDGKYWDSYSPNPILGDVKTSNNHQMMWRWQSLRDYSFKDILTARATYPNNLIMQALEWNVPGHEHCSMGLIANQFGSSPNCNALAEFEYKFDNSDADVTGGKAQGWTKSTNSGHAKAVEAVSWLEQNYPTQSYTIFAHPERKSTYKVSDFRDMNNAAPNVAFGFESMPGHQKGNEGAGARGEYSFSKYNTDGACTYGGTGIYAAKVGGLWDAMLGEGRKWWLFASSDSHAVGADSDMKKAADFFPGEYQLTYTYVSNKMSAQSIIDGLRSGNSWVVMGDLIDSLNFTINGFSMGQTVNAVNGKATINITFRDPQTNNFNTYSSYKNPSVDHIDIIAGNVTAKKQPGTEEYFDATNSSAKVIARFDGVGGIKDTNNLVSAKWTDLGGGEKTMSLTINVTGNMYVRLRGTNMGINVDKQTDGAGNPLPDSLITSTAATAFDDLWFYSNPIFINNSSSSKANDLIPNEFSLGQNVPNPFNPRTSITFHLSRPGDVNLTVYDALGRKVATLIEGKMRSGSHSVTWNAENFSSGTYHYVLENDGKSFVRKMTIVK